MKNSAAVALLIAVGAAAKTDPDFRQALPGYRHEFPRDHFDHPEFRTEWWYFTGNLSAAEGRRFGYELTFFRHALHPELSGSSIWDVRDVWMAHFALTDIDGKRFLHTERLNRTGPGLAGASVERSRIWNGNWSLDWRLDRQKKGGVAGIELQGIAESFDVKLELVPLKGPVIHGENGVSQKSAGAGRASHYISYTRIQSRGTVQIEGRSYSVEGLSWMDHEIFSNSLEANQSGWDWFSLQFDDGSELMLYRLRRKDGTIEPFSSGTYLDAAGRSKHLALRDYSVVPGRRWKSSETGAAYPVEWQVRVPSLGIDVSITALLDRQELTGRTRSAPVYWEGAIGISGTRRGEALRGSGYLEMTGYAGAVGPI